ncbi:peptidoglycan endopeptidase [Pseudomonas sp. Choline-3u-10]|jgi:cell wall-associated NlpC family hydrolase|uniref:C40 family peptidase n=1 Tax=Pseudomonadaceae TaxID=135621 RepID=UPI000617E637|nr:MULTISPECIES: C40 family peptidase [Pseudomonadaceae]MAL35747.1 peptidoglycan endopeptidase [Pseudomonas sp.]MBU0949430.1 C40 family peptidase [Gammaproteobacteria bacterium]KJJ63834.1 peptidase P60 [Pseudomonas sp. 10B238]MBK3795045.1 peptidoglycan endopeptidase [Stutzerimonas stutzeri]MBK3878602.1 peptidoglycan endopeptidase [Stutzerimonas stutzeri]|tara:strand:- start:2144 stop:2791 length:648 start_codon:yes stop_codon:yes gene_type:complete
MRQRLAPLLPFALITLLTACAMQPEQTESPLLTQRFQFDFPIETSEADADPEAVTAEPTDQQLPEFADDESYELPALADSLLERGFTLVGTPYRYGGSSRKTGFDCSGFVSFLFRKEAGIELPRSTREMINLDAPKIKRSELEPGDVVFFNNRGRGQVSHAGIYIGGDRFIHSSSSRSGGVRVDSLDDKYWRSSFMQAKRVLALAHNSSTIPTHH